jgi:Calcium-dependent channel, 7TM region, putative phosphate
MFMSKFEGHICTSILERKSAFKYYFFLVVNVFLGSVMIGSAFEQLNAFLHQTANEYVFLLKMHIFNTGHLCYMHLMVGA